VSPRAAGLAVGLAERHAVADAAWGDEEPEPRAWSSGPWSLEVRGDELADLAVDGTVVLRGIKAVIRDRDWGTVPSQPVAVTMGADSLEVELRFSGLGGEFSGMLRAEVSATGDALRVTTELRALVPFERNRAGLVVLLPAEAAGSALRVEHADGSGEQLALPEQIAPHQPAVDIAALEWTHAGIRSELAFEGDIFEMEDQRNWTDASFKVYSTPLSLPFPVALAAGATVAQALELRAERVAAAAVPTPSVPLELRPAGRAIPAIGTSASTGPDPVETPALDPGTLLVELDLAAANWRPLLIRAATEAGDAALDVRLISDDPAVIAAAIDELAPLAPARLGVFSAVTHVTEEAGWRALSAAVAAAGLDAELVGGTRAHFTELNRNHERLPAGLPALSYSSTPQMHARERAQLVESVAIQRLTARDAVRIAAGRPVHLGPVTLRPRFNAVATTPPPPEPPDLGHGSGPAHLEGATDPRQGSPALAAWLVASAAASAIAGITSLSFFEASGSRGVAGHPVEEAFAWLRELSGHPVLEADQALPPGVWMLAADAPAGPIALIANLNSEPAALTLTLDSRTVELALEPLTARRVLLGPVGETRDPHREQPREADSR
jgi:hypothetical protein